MVVFSPRLAERNKGLCTDMIWLLPLIGGLNFMGVLIIRALQDGG